jgi:hypothetical protein
VELFRLVFFGEVSGPALLSPAGALGYAAASAMAACALGIAVFRRHEDTLADWVLG